MLHCADKAWLNVWEKYNEANACSIRKKHCYQNFHALILRSPKTVIKAAFITWWGYSDPHLGEEVLLKPKTNGKAWENLEGDLLALLHKCLQHVHGTHLERKGLKALLVAALPKFQRGRAYLSSMIQEINKEYVCIVESWTFPVCKPDN